jgi:hypothetical protein
MNPKRMPLRQAMICLSSTPRADAWREQLLSSSHREPVLVAWVSDETLRHSLHAGGQSQFGVALRTSEQGCYTAVLTLQVDGFQLRCVASLSSIALVKLARAANRSGMVHLAFHGDDGAFSGLLPCPVHEHDVALLLGALRARRPASGELWVADAVLTAANCRDVDELGTLISGLKVQRVEACVVVDELTGAISSADWHL